MLASSADRIDHTAQSQVATLNSVDTSSSQIDSQITGKANGASEAGLAYAIVAKKPAGQIVKLSPEIA